jgi:hypothetical protein
MTMTIGLAYALATAALLAYCLSLIPLRWQRRGGLTFWRIGSLCGSICISRNTLEG